MDPSSQTVSVVMAAGRGSRMKGYAGNKTLLPLKPGPSIFQGERPMLQHILENLPAGPRALVVNHCKADVIQATRAFNVEYCEQPRLNGTGGAILAAAGFIERQSCPHVIITMGDVPFVKATTYTHLLEGLADHDLMVLGFCPKDRKQYGVLETEDNRVCKITEWKYWREYPQGRQDALTVCNSGIYAAKKEMLTRYLPIMASRPQIVHKEVDGRMTAIEEFFITDLIEHMVADGGSVGYQVTCDELETMGIDDADALRKAQEIYRQNS
jgi:bifunctional UDP-N-acetylglucosamine pyrophosphorylase/glucosamine-1-phosphate N-acetyltransferase